MLERADVSPCLTLLAALLSVFLLAAPAPAARLPQQDSKARHRQEDREWARKTGMPAETIRRLRLLAEVTDDSDELIDSIDANSLRRRRQILVVTYGGNGHCLALYVIQRRARDYHLLWSAGGMPGGAGFCRASPVNPSTYVSRGGKLVVKIPVFDYSRGRSEGAELYTYVWNGQTYKFVHGKTPKRKSAG